MHAMRALAPQLKVIAGTALALLGVSSSLPAQQLLFSEDFDAVTLGPAVDESIVVTEFWSNSTAQLPGWSIDNSDMPSGGVTEWQGWAFTDPDLWAITDLQNRGQFTKGENVIAVADPDEWHDLNPGDGYYSTLLRTPQIAVTGVASDALSLQFDSSWRPEGGDDIIGGAFPPQSNNQTALIRVAYDGGSFDTEILRWESLTTSGFFKGPATNETVTVGVPIPAGTSSVSLEFGMVDARNDWWWALDNIGVYDGDPTLSLVIDRDGDVTIQNNTNDDVSLTSYSIVSQAGTLDSTQYSPLAESIPGWVAFEPAQTEFVVGEGHLTTGTIANEAQLSLGELWRGYFVEAEDIRFEYTTPAGEVIEGIVRFEGNNGEPFRLGDFNFSGGPPDALDWPSLRDNFASDLAALSPYEAYQHGDINGDGFNDLNDFLLFKQIFIAANGEAAFCSYADVKLSA